METKKGLKTGLKTGWYSAFFLASRQLKTRWKQSLLSILSVAVGVMILTTALSLTNGFENDMIHKILGTTPHISLKPGTTDYLENYQVLQTQLLREQKIDHAFPVMRQQALVSNPLHTTGALVLGIPPQSAAEGLARFLKKGEWQIQGKPSLVVGSALANKLQLFLKDEVQLITPTGSTTFYVSGIFHSGLYDLDARMVVSPLDQVQAVFQTPDGVNEIFVQLHDVFEAPELAAQIQQEYPTLYIRTWMESNRNLLSAMALEKKVIFLVILFIIVVAMMGIANTQIMVVMEKTPDIAILRAMGARRRQISQIFLCQGVMIGTIGVGLGAALGVGLSLYLRYFPVRIPGDVYDLDYLPVHMEWADFITVAGATLVICILASFFPARRASRAEPMSVFRRHI